MKPSYIYVIAASSEGPVKIGFSKEPEKRLRQLQTGHSEPLHLFYKEEVNDAARLMEKAVHDTIGYKRARGEWFNVTADDAIAEIRHALIFHSDSKMI